MALAAGGQAEIPPFSPSPPNNTAHNSRKLLIWGTDDRVQVLSRAYPFSAVGNIRGEEANGISYGCSGAVVAASTIFTAGALMSTWTVSNGALSLAAITLALKANQPKVSC